MPAMFRRRQIWMPTWWTASVLIVVVAVAALLALRQLASFLALDAPAATRDGHGARTLIVEGWLDEDALDAAIALIARGRYERVVASGGPSRAGATASRGRRMPSGPPTTCVATA